MTRVIKFRAWDSAKQKMGKPWSLNSQICLPPKEDEHWLDRFPSHILFLQFTGFKDKKGMEIYEGDIVKFKDDIVSILWIECDAMFSFSDGNDWLIFTENSLKSFEVIGNIYQNPELLK